MGKPLTSFRAPWGYLAREAALILLWAYIVLVGGTVNGLFSFELQFASAVLLAVIAALWLGGRWRQRRGLPFTGMEWAVVAFLALQFAAVLLSQDVRRSLPIAAQTIAYVLIFYCACDLSRSGWPAELTEKTLLIVGGIAVGLALLDLLQTYLRWLAIVVGLPYAPGFEYRIYAPLGDANLVSSFLNVIVPLAAARALTTPARLPRIMLSLLVLTALLAQFFTASRGGLAELVASLIVMALAWVGVVSPSARERALRLWDALRRRPVILAGLAVVILAGSGYAVWRILRFEGSATQAPIFQARREFWGPALAAFQASPVWGGGPGTFPTDFIRGNSVPPVRPFLHAHSVLFNTAAEAGLTGLMGVVIAVVAIARALWRARALPSLESRARWAAVSAMSVGFAVHSQVDDHTRYLSVAVPLGIMLAVVLAESSPDKPHRTFHPLWLVAPALAVGAFSFYALRAHALAEQAADFGGEDWARAAQLFDEAALDDPALAFYWQEAGYAYGRGAVEGDPIALSKAIDRLERAQTLEPSYSVIAANLAALYWQAGRGADALATMQRAAELAPNSALYHLNLGLYAEGQGRAAEARASYTRALDLNPLQAGSNFWAQTPLRAALLVEWQARRDPDAAPFAERIQRLIANAELEAAERELIAAWAENDQNLSVYRGLAALARARGDLDRAERYMECALWAQTVDVHEQTWAMLEAAELSRARGDVETALGRYTVVLDAVTDYGAYGWGSGAVGWTPYAFFVFQRRGFGEEVLPQLSRADFTIELGRRLLALAELHEGRGENDEAASVYRRLLAADPSLTEAREALERLGAP